MNTTPTWVELGVEEMRRGMALMLQGTPYFAWQNSDNEYHPCRHLNQLTQFEVGIFAGTHTVGFYSIRPDNLTRWGAIDFDNHDGSKSRDYWLPHAQRAFENLKNQFAEAWFLESSPGGFHVIVFAAVPMPAADMRRILQAHAPKGVEVFPKQDALDASKPNAKGSLLRFPGKHQLKGTWALFIARSGHVQEVEEIPVPKSSRYQEPSAKAGFFSLYVQVTSGLKFTSTERRFNVMQKIVGRLKGRTLDEKIAVDVHDRFYNQHHTEIQTPIEKSRAYFLTWFRKAAPCNVLPDYPTTEVEEVWISKLPAINSVPQHRLAAIVRLFLSAKKHADKTSREFFLSLPTIAERLGVGIASASKYRNTCYQIGLIEMVQRGSYIHGKASTYKPGKKWPK